MESNSLGKLLPKGINPKRRRKKEPPMAEATSSNDESTPSRRRSRPTTGSFSTGTPDDARSQVSAESDPDSFSLPRSASTIPTQPSPSGPSTAGSPAAQDARLPQSQSSNTTSSETSRRRASTLPAGSSDLAGSSSSLASSDTGLAPPVPSIKRSSSPVGRLKDVFKAKKGAPSNASSSPEPSARPAESDGASEASKSAAGLARPEAEDALTTHPESTASSDRVSRRLSRNERLDTTALPPPRTPPSGDGDTTPLIVNTPPTPTAPDHPTPLPSFPKEAWTSHSTSPFSNVSPLGNMIAQRRGRSGSSGLGPSKLSSITLAPLTPTQEARPSTPGNASSSFFSSMISAVQNTANTLSNSLGQAGGSPKLPAPKERAGREEGDSVEVEPSASATAEPSTDAKEPAVKTLGMGDLSLSHLGIAEATSTAPTPMSARFPDLGETRGRSDSAPVESTRLSFEPSSDEPLALDSRPRSLDDAPTAGERTPPPGSLYDGKGGVQRSGSIRSAVGRRRKRGSSTATGGTAATGTTIGAAIAAATASAAHPLGSGTPRLTGFAVASKKRNRDFHALFKSVPDDDYLIEDYSCALQREILAHGRLYVSEGHICFSSNIFGWVTTLVMSFDEIVSVEKRSTALVFKNGLEISTLHAKHVFASFTSRDSTYDLIVKIWKLGHPSLRSSLNGVRLNETGGDRTEKVDADPVGGSQTASGSEDDSDGADDDIYDEDEEDGDVPDAPPLLESSFASEGTDKPVARKASGMVAANGVSEKEDDGSAAPAAADDFPGPASHPPTDCGDAASHYDKFLGDEVIPAPLGKVYTLLFGPASPAWMGRWLTTDQKCTDLQMDDKKGLTESARSRTFTYIKPLYASIGPKQTKCIVTEQLESINLEKAVTVVVTTQTPDVPSGNVFGVKTRYCLSWAENNATRVQVNCAIEWTGKSWLKVAIEKGANDGQAQYCRELFASLRSAVLARPKSGPLRPKKKGRKGKSAQAYSPASDVEGRPPKVAAKQDWGLFEPARPFLSPVVDTVRPLLTGNVVYGLLVGLLVAAWFGFGTHTKAPRPYGSAPGYVGYPDRLAAYDEMWRREESELWEWLQERVGIDRLVTAGGAPRKVVADPAVLKGRAREERISDTELKEAIKVTEEKLRVLKSVVEQDARAPGEE